MLTLVTAAIGPTSVSGWEALGFTVVAAMFFLAGALGAWARAVISETEVVLSQRMVVDLLIGGAGGILLPIFSPVLDRLLAIEFATWTSLQQAVLAFLIGGGGSWLWTAIGWRTGLIVTPKQAANGGRGPKKPEVGVLLKPPVEPPVPEREEPGP